MTMPVLVAGPGANATPTPEPAAAQPVSRAGATERVVAEVRAAIERGDLKAGDRLAPERELAARYGVSRPTVRSALKALAAMGIVHARQGAGTFITAGPPTLDSRPLTYLAALHGFTRRQMFEARMALEVAVAGYAAERATPDTLIHISDETTAMFASLDEPLAFLAHDIQFHRAIAAAAGNPVLAAMVDMVSAIFQQARRDRIQFARDLRSTAEEHRAIYLALRAGDPERARQAMLDHLRRADRSQTEEEAEAGLAAAAAAATPTP
jgi:GntR family transcriptional repressor for pyruvate dehydrogenase complex